MPTTENPSDSTGFTINELADASGVEPRTIRSYVEKGLIPGPDSLGRGARYPKESLDRLKVLQLLRDANRTLTLDQIRMLLQSIGPSELSALAEGRMRIGSLIATHDANEPGKSSAIDYLRSLRGDSKPANAPAAHRQRQAHVDDDQLPVLEEAARALAKLAGLSTASRSIRGEHWYRLPLTPDIELSVRGSFGSDQLAQFHRIGDALRLLLTKGLRK
jgi:DNA-binding transcriptional MerR regulator